MRERGESNKEERERERKQWREGESERERIELDAKLRKNMKERTSWDARKFRQHLYEA